MLPDQVEQLKKSYHNNELSQRKDSDSGDRLSPGIYGKTVGGNQSAPQSWSDKLHREEWHQRQMAYPQ